MNSFIAFSLDNYNKKEHIIYCIGHANEFFADKTKNIFAETREIGELAIDFSSNNDNYGAEERQNLIFDYLSEYKRFVEINAHQWNCDDEQIERRKAMTEMIDILNNYKGSKGKKYKSDYLTIRGWVKDKYYENMNRYGQQTGTTAATDIGKPSAKRTFRDTL